MSATTEQMFLTREEAAKVAGVSFDTIKRAINKGTLRAKRSGEGGGGKYLVSRDALQAWFDGLVDA